MVITSQLSRIKTAAFHIHWLTNLWSFLFLLYHRRRKPCGHFLDISLKKQTIVLVNRVFAREIRVLFENNWLFGVFCWVSLFYKFIYKKTEPHDFTVITPWKRDIPCIFSKITTLYRSFYAKIEKKCPHGFLFLWAIKNNLKKAELQSSTWKAAVLSLIGWESMFIV